MRTVKVSNARNFVPESVASSGKQSFQPLRLGLPRPAQKGEQRRKLPPTTSHAIGLTLTVKMAMFVVEAELLSQLLSDSPKAVVVL